MKIGIKKSNTQENEARTRADEQSYINHLCILGKISMDEWRKRCDELSDIKLWVAAGKIKK